MVAVCALAGSTAGTKIRPKTMLVASKNLVGIFNVTISCFIQIKHLD